MSSSGSVFDSLSVKGRVLLVPVIVGVALCVLGFLASKSGGSAVLYGAVAVTVVGLFMALAVGASLARPLDDLSEAIGSMSSGESVSGSFAGPREYAVLFEGLRDMSSGSSGGGETLRINSQKLDHAVGELRHVVSKTESDAQKTRDHAGQAGSVLSMVQNNTQTVATAVEELSSSIGEISKNAVEAARVASSAVEKADHTNVIVAKLGDSSQEISNVVRVITSIAEQTNLLALNATIEAARAGESGKGFAVVANEVKELAKETAKATEEISQRIEGIQGDTESAVSAIEEITAVISQISDFQTTIASAVEEQTATTSSLAENVNQAANGAREVNTHIDSVNQSTTDSDGNTTRYKELIAEVADAAHSIQDGVFGIAR